jgi:hypothetical protein
MWCRVSLFLRKEKPETFVSGFSMAKNYKNPNLKLFLDIKKYKKVTKELFRVTFA